MTSRPITDSRIRTITRMSAEMLATGHPCWSDAFDDLMLERARLLGELHQANADGALAEAQLRAALQQIVDVLEPQDTSPAAFVRGPLRIQTAAQIAREALE